jgi:hypothetical protein
MHRLRRPDFVSRSIPQPPVKVHHSLNSAAAQIDIEIGLCIAAGSSRRSPRCSARSAFQAAHKASIELRTSLPPRFNTYCTAVSLVPVHDREALDSTELFHVVGDQRDAMGHGRAGDQSGQRPNGEALSLETRSDASRRTGLGRSEGKDGQQRHELGEQGAAMLGGGGAPSLYP